MDANQDVPAGILEPWLIVEGQLPQVTCGLWQLAGNKGRAVAMFSDAARARTYLESLDETADPGAPGSDGYRAVKFSELELVRILAICFQSDILYAVLNPGVSTAPQLFVLRDVLKAAKNALIEQREAR